MEGWVDLGYPAIHKPGVKLAISQSQVRRPNHYTAEPPSVRLVALLSGLCVMSLTVAVCHRHNEWVVLINQWIMCMYMCSVIELRCHRSRHLPDSREGSVCIMDNGYGACCSILLSHHLSCISHLSHLVHWMLRNSLQEQNHPPCCMYWCWLLLHQLIALWKVFIHMQ